MAPLIVPAEWLPRIVSGTAAVSVRTDDAPYLLDADVAELLVIQSGHGVSVAVPDAVELTAQPSVDPTRRLYSAAGGGPIQDRDAGCRCLRRAFDLAALATAAQLLGLGRHLLAEAVTYAGQRRQYGRQIGSFQAIKHRLADVAIGLEFAAPVVYRAAYSATHEMPTASLDASAAKVRAAEAARQAARAALQVHGAIGYTDELDLHLWLARVWSLRTAWGGDRLHRARYGSRCAPRAAGSRSPRVRPWSWRPQAVAGTATPPPATAKPPPRISPKEGAHDEVRGAAGPGASGHLARSGHRGGSARLRVRVAPRAPGLRHRPVDRELSGHLGAGHRAQHPAL